MSASTFEEVPLVLDRDQRSLRSIVHGQLQRLDERAKRLEIPLDTHISKDQQRRLKGSASYRRKGCGNESDANLSRRDWPEDRGASAVARPPPRLTRPHPLTRPGDKRASFDKQRGPLRNRKGPLMRAHLLCASMLRRMATYDPLFECLCRAGDEPVVLTFNDIERLVGGLPASASSHPGWWATRLTVDGTLQARAWLETGAVSRKPTAAGVAFGSRHLSGGVARS